MNVWTYWAGPMPSWIQICLDSMRSRCGPDARLHVLTPATAPAFVPDLNSRWLTLPSGVGTDCLRAHLLARHGGLWLDADTILLTDPCRLLQDRHLHYQFLYSRWRDGRAVAGYVYAPESHPVACRWRDGVDSALRYAEGIGWGELGEQLLTWCLRGVCGPSAWEMPLATFLPIDIDQDVQRFFTEERWQDCIKDVTIAFGLNHSWMQANRPEQMAADPLSSPILVHRLLSYALRSL